MSEILIFQHRPLVKAKTLLLDRDGVLNKVITRGSEISSPRFRGELVLSDDISALAEPPIANDWNLIVVSNQPDLARGRIDLDLVKYINWSIMQHIPLNASYICPHVAADGCRCRKPKTGLIERFKKDFPQAVEKMVLVGDRDTDQECAKRAGVDFILRRQEYNIYMTNVNQALESLLDLPTMLQRIFPQ